MSLSQGEAPSMSPVRRFGNRRSSLLPCEGSWTADDHLCGGSSHANSSAYLSDLCGLLFELGREDLHCFLLLCDCRFLSRYSGVEFSDTRLLLLDSLVLFEKFVKQHGVDLLVAN